MLARAHMQLRWMRLAGGSICRCASFGNCKGAIIIECINSNIMLFFGGDAYVHPISFVVKVGVALLCVEQEDLSVAEAGEGKESKSRPHDAFGKKKKKKGNREQK